MNTTKPMATTSTKSGTTDPTVVKAFNTARESSVKSGTDPYAGNLKDYATFNASYNKGSGSSGVTSSSGNSRKEESNLGKDITTMTDPRTYSGAFNPSPHINDMDKMIESLYQSDVFGIKGKYEQAQKDMEGAQTRETGTESVGIARAGGYLGYSGSGQGVLLNLQATHKADIGKLNAQKDAALNEARKAYLGQKYDVAKLKLDEAKGYEEKVYQRRQDYFDRIKDVTKKEDELATEQSIYEAMQGGAKSVNDIFKKLGGKVSAGDISTFLESITPKTTGAFKLTNEDTAKLLGSGLSQADIESSQNYISENGYTDEFRKTLTSRERSIFDSIYYPKTPSGGSGSGVGGTLTIAEAKSLGLPVSLIGRSQNQVISDLNSSTPPSWFSEYTTSNWADPNTPVDPEGLRKLWQPFRTAILSEFVGGAKSGSGSSGGAPDYNDIP